MQDRIPMQIEAINSLSQDNKQDNQQMVVSDEKLPAVTSLSFVPVYTTTAPTHLKADLIKFREAIANFSQSHDESTDEYRGLAYDLWDKNPSLRAWLIGEKVNLTTENPANPQTISPSDNEVFRNFRAIARAIVLLMNKPFTLESEYADIIETIWKNNKKLQNIVKNSDDFEVIDEAIRKTNKILDRFDTLYGAPIQRSQLKLLNTDDLLPLYHDKKTKRSNTSTVDSKEENDRSKRQKIIGLSSETDVSDRDLITENSQEYRDHFDNREFLSSYYAPTITENEPPPSPALDNLLNTIAICQSPTCCFFKNNRQNNNPKNEQPGNNFSSPKP